MAAPSEPQTATPTTLSRFGFYASLAAAVVTLAAFVNAVLTPPLSGPYCRSGCFTYPFTDIASRFPRDYYWMGPAMLSFIAFGAMVVAVHHWASRDKKVYSHLGLLLATVAIASLLIDYWVQLAVVQPSLLQGEHDGISLLSQFNAHGVFIALEELGFTFICLALLALVPVFDGGTSLERALRWVFILAFVFAALGFGYYVGMIGLQREYRYEVAIISIAWLDVIVGGFLLALLFRRVPKRG